MKTLICLVGGQVSPNLFSIYKTEPDKLILIATNETLDSSNDFGLLVVSKFPNIQIESITIESHNLESILVSLDELKNNINFEGNEVFVNYAASTKQAALGLFLTFKNTSANLLYVDSQNELFRFYKNGTFTNEPLNISVSLDEWVAFKGHRIKAKGDDAVAMRLATLTNRIFEERYISKNKPYNSLFYRAYQIQFDKNVKNLSIIGQYGDIHVKKSTKENEISIVYLGQIVIEETEEWILKYLNGGWFEIWAYLKLLNTKEYDDVWYGVEFDLQKRKPSKKIRNEIDVLAIRRGKLILVECKTDKIVQDYIYKLDSLRQMYASNYTQSVLAATRGMDESILDKANELNVITINGSDRLLNEFNNLYTLEVIKK